MTDKDRKDKNRLVKAEREKGVRSSVGKILDGDGLNFQALTGLHTYCEALIRINQDMRETLRREGVKSGAEVDEIKKIIKDAENCQYFIERLYKEDLEMKGVEVRWNERYLWCGEEEWTEMVEAWKHYLFVRSYGTDRKDWD